MAVMVMLYGQSGSGKSTSFRNFKKEDVAIVSVSNKPLPFRNTEGLQVFSSSDYLKIYKAISNATAHSIIIDDATFLLSKRVLDKADEGGYGKWSVLAKEFNRFLQDCAALPDDKIVYFIGHTDIDGNTGRECFKKFGKMLDDALCSIEAMFVIVIKALIRNGEYVFQTHSEGLDTVKTPMGMFEETYIPNDLRAVDRVIREYMSIEKESNQE